MRRLIVLLDEAFAVPVSPPLMVRAAARSASLEPLFVCTGATAVSCGSPDVWQMRLHRIGTCDVAAPERGTRRQAALLQIYSWLQTTIRRDGAAAIHTFGGQSVDLIAAPLRLEFGLPWLRTSTTPHTTAVLPSATVGLGEVDWFDGVDVPTLTATPQIDSDLQVVLPPNAMLAECEADRTPRLRRVVQIEPSDHLSLDATTVHISPRTLAEAVVLLSIAATVTEPPGGSWLATLADRIGVVVQHRERSGLSSYRAAIDAALEVGAALQ